jgi:hypothetical protein
MIKYSYNSCSQFNNYWFPTVYQVTFQNKYPKCPPPESVHTWTRLIMDCHALSEVPGLMRMVWWASQICWRNVCPFSIVAEHTVVFKFPLHIKSLQFGLILGLCLENCLRTYITSFLVLVWGTRSWSLSKHFRDILYTYHNHTSNPTSHRWSRTLIWTKSVQPDGNTGTEHDNAKQHILLRPPMVVVGGENDMKT